MGCGGAEVTMEQLAHHVGDTLDAHFPLVHLNGRNEAEGISISVMTTSLACTWSRRLSRAVAESMCTSVNTDLAERAE